MAGMFYTFEEVLEKLGKTEDQIKDLITEGKLREFRDGAKRMFKVDEVDQLASAEPEEIDISEITGGDSEVALVADETNEIFIEPEAEEETEGPEEPEELNLGDMTGDDTSITTIGINVLSETDDEYKLSDDTKGETQIDETSDQFADLDEEDLSLDSVGSGSGLLDLSLQADDTSLGAVLDDILPGGQGEGEVVAMDEQGNLTEEAENIFEEAAPETEMPEPAGRAVMPVYIQPEPDAVSNACGYSLFIPLVAMVFAVIVLLAGFKSISPAMLKSVEAPLWYDVPMIWYIVAGLAVLSIVIIGIAAMAGGKGQKKKKENVYQQPE